MVIGYDGSRAFIQDKTGTENYSHQLLKALAKIDKRNQYIVYLRPGVKNLEEWPKNFQFKVIPWLRFWTQGGLALQTFKDRLDLLFIPAHTLPLIRKTGLKTVITVHDLGSQYLPSMHQIKQQLYLSLMQKYQLKTADKIIAVSKATKMDLIKKIGIDPNKITVVYEGYDKKRFKIKDLRIKNDIKDNSLRQYGLKPQKYFLFVGTVQPRKNLERIIQAFANILSLRDHEVAKQSSSGINKIATVRQGGPRNDGVALVIAGSKGWLSDDIYKLPKKLGIEDQVRFLNYVPDKDLPALYHGAIALVFPSLFEGFGLPILEAQASGCPVITSNLSSMPEIAGKGAILVDPYSVEDIIRGIGEIRGIREKLIKAGLENVKRFSWEKAARETLAVLEAATLSS